MQALLSLLTAQRFPAAFFVAVFHAWFEALALAVHCSPGALFHAWFEALATLFTALSFSSLELSGSSQLVMDFLLSSCS